MRWAKVQKAARYILPPVLVDLARRVVLRVRQKSDPLLISYENVDPPDRTVTNACGTHLNESGDTRPVNQYIKTFDLEQELKKEDVSDNLLFIDNVISPLLARDATLVDLGCGIGRYARFLCRPNAPTVGWSYSGVDLSEEIIRFSKVFCPECEFKATGGGATIPYQDYSKDLVMASSMLQYTCENWEAWLREMKRVAKKYLFISRLPILRKSPSAYCHQKVFERGRTNHHYFKILNRHEFEAAIARIGCTLVARDYGSEVLFLEGISEPVILNLYLIAKG
jgi:ubiquinone/menaquinone biosynthesis C-methylase UbiE